MKKKFIVFSFLFVFSCATTPNKQFDIKTLAYQEEIKKINKNLANGEFLISHYDYKNSQRFFENALKKSKDIQYNDGIVASLNNLGVVFLKLDKKKALTFFQLALSNAQYPQDKADCYNNIGFYYLSQNNKKSLSYFEKALKFNKNGKKKYNILNNIGLYYFHFSNYKKAEQLFQKVIKKSMKIHYYQLLCKALLNQGDLYFKSKISKAKYFYKESLDNAHFWEYDQGMMNALEKLIIVANKENDKKNLLLYYKSLAKIHKKFKMMELYKKDLKIIHQFKK